MKILGPSQAMKLIKSGATVIPGGFGSCGHPDLFTQALEERYLETGEPKNLKLLFASGAGDKKENGLNRLAHYGLVSVSIGGYWNLCPKLRGMGESGEIEAHNWPQGAISKLFGTIAEGAPGLVSRVGLHTFVDPRVEGGMFRPIDHRSLIEVVHLQGKEYLFYPSMHIDAALLRGTVADRSGNISLRGEASKMDALSQAQAARNCGGIVFVQVKDVVSDQLCAGEVDIPGHLVDVVVISKGTNHPFTYGHKVCPTKLTTEEGVGSSARQHVIKRALKELPVGPYKKRIVNFGIGIPAEIGMAMSANQRSSYTLSVESGVIGGTPLIGDSFGAAIDPDAVVDQSQLFNFYDGGGIDKAFLGFAQIDEHGRVNVSKFGKARPGAGGFINITTSAKNIIFCGTLTTTRTKGNKVEGYDSDILKLVENVDQITFDSKHCNAAKITVITEVAVFEIRRGALVLTEVREGFEPKDVEALSEAHFEVDHNLSSMG
ncbi:CoA-transferase [Halomonas sp. HK25]|uniref:CoA-transferase n=1 Tax=Halomonas sp. HK25 TaxID=3394321 RepID=UPI0039FBFCA6